MRDALPLLLLLAVAGCASRGGRGADEALDANAAAQIEGLPAPLFALGAGSLPFQDLWLAGEQSLDDALPPPDIADEAAFGAWVERQLRPFLDRRAAAVRDMERERRRLPAERIEERVMAEALFALVLERAARPVLEAAVPVTVARPGRERVLREALDAAVAGLLHEAHDAYARCLRLSRGAPPHLSAWRRHCAEHLQALPAPGSPAAGPRL